MNAGDTWLISERLFLVSVPVYDLYTLSVCLFMCFVVVCVCAYFNVGLWESAKGWTVLGKVFLETNSSSLSWQPSLETIPILSITNVTVR